MFRKWWQFSLVMLAVLSLTACSRPPSYTVRGQVLESAERFITDVVMSVQSKWGSLSDEEQKLVQSYAKTYSCAIANQVLQGGNASDSILGLQRSMMIERERKFNPSSAATMEILNRAYDISQFEREYKNSNNVEKEILKVGVFVYCL